MKRQNQNSLRKIFRAVLNLLVAIALLAAFAQPSRAETNTTKVSTNTPLWLTRPLSLADCLNLTLQQNGTILKARSSTFGAGFRSMTVKMLWGAKICFATDINE